MFRRLYHKRENAVRWLLASLWILASAPISSALEIGSKTETDPFPGIHLIEGTTSNPTLTFVAALVSLCTPGVKMDATGFSGSYQTAQQWGNPMDAKVAINGDYYRTDVGYPCMHGPAVGNAAIWPSANMLCDPNAPPQRSGWIAFGPGWVEFSHTAQVKQNPALYQATQGFRPAEVTQEIPAGTLALVGGYSELVTEGALNDCSKDQSLCQNCWCDRADLRDNHQRHRTAMGLTQDRKTFIMLVVDDGTGGINVAALMQKLGAWQAFELDGGGSSQMWVKGRGLIMTPEGGSARAVANHWGAFSAGSGDAPNCPADLPEEDSSLQGEDDGSAQDGGGGGESNAQAENGPDGQSQHDDSSTDNDSLDSGDSCGCQSPHVSLSYGLMLSLAVLLLARRFRG